MKKSTLKSENLQHSPKSKLKRMLKEILKKALRELDSLEPKEMLILKRESKSDSMSLKSKRNDVLLFK